MSYLVLITVFLVTVLGLISLFDEARAQLLEAKRRAEEAQKQKRAEQAIKMKGHLHQMDPETFQKWVADIYTDLGHRTKIFTRGDERTLLLAKEGVYTLVGLTNHAWPISQQTLEKLAYKKRQMEADQLVVLSTSGFNLNAWEWTAMQPDIKLISEAGLFDLYEETAFLKKAGLLQKHEPSPAQTTT